MECTEIATGVVLQKGLFKNFAKCKTKIPVLQSVTKYCDTTSFFIKRYAYRLPHHILPLFNDGSMWKFFGIALMAAWYIWQVYKLKGQHLNCGKGVCATIFVGDFLKVKNCFDRDLP